MISRLELGLSGRTRFPLVHYNRPPDTKQQSGSGASAEHGQQEKSFNLENSIVYFSRLGFIPGSKATVSIFSQAVQYGISGFEGILCSYNESDNKYYIFRLNEHYERLCKAAEKAGVTIQQTKKQFLQNIIEVIRLNGIKKDLYIRPNIFRVSQELPPTIAPTNISPLETIFISPIENKPNIENGKKLRVSSNPKPTSDDGLYRRKQGGNFFYSAAVKHEAMSEGFDDSILLNPNGYIA